MALSYAEQRALEIGITIAGGADVLLLDEPTAGMSRSEANEAMALIRRLAAGKTLLMIEHDMSVVFALADRIAVLDQGAVLACDSPERVRADNRVRAAYLGSDAGMES
ncbi:Fluoroquinolones export ATP-binding protein [compost metagenome]